MITTNQLLDGLDNAANIMLSKMPRNNRLEHDDLVNMGYVQSCSADLSKCKPGFVLTDCYQWIIKGIVRITHSDNKHYREDLSRLDIDYDRLLFEPVDERPVGCEMEVTDELAHILSKAELTSQEAEIIRRRYWEKEPYKVIAKEMGISSRQTARNMHARALRQLRKAV
jgi:RNA polymerase sigma factor (sigma-70 family)